MSRQKCACSWGGLKAGHRLPRAPSLTLPDVALHAVAGVQVAASGQQLGKLGAPSASSTSTVCAACLCCCCRCCNTTASLLLFPALLTVLHPCLLCQPHSVEPAAGSFVAFTQLSVPLLPALLQALSRLTPTPLSSCASTWPTSACSSSSTPTCSRWVGGGWVWATSDSNRCLVLCTMWLQSQLQLCMGFVWPLQSTHTCGGMHPSRPLTFCPNSSNSSPSHTTQPAWAPSRCHPSA
jgi:hypothetical protein